MLNQIPKWKRMILTAMQVITKAEALTLALNLTVILLMLGDANMFGALSSPQVLPLWIGDIWNATNAFVSYKLQSKSHLQNPLLTTTLGWRVWLRLHQLIFTESPLGNVFLGTYSVLIVRERLLLRETEIPADYGLVIAEYNVLPVISRRLWSSIRRIRNLLKSKRTRRMRWLGSVDVGQFFAVLAKSRRALLEESTTLET